MNGSKTKYSLKIIDCPVCGRRFIPAPEHLYKIYENGVYSRVCSWTCMRKHEKKKMKQQEN